MTNINNPIFEKFLKRKQNSLSFKVPLDYKLRELDNFYRQKQRNEFSYPESNIPYDIPDNSINYSNLTDEKKQEFLMESRNAGTISTETYENESRYITDKKIEEQKLLEIEFRGTNLLAECVEKKTGKLLGLNPKPQVRTEDKNNVEKVQKFQAILSTVWDKKDMNNHVNDAIVLSKLKPSAFTWLNWNSNLESQNPHDEDYNGDFEVQLLDPANVLWEPSAYDFKEMNYVILVFKSSLDSLKIQYRSNEKILNKLKSLEKNNEGVSSLSNSEAAGQTYSPNRLAETDPQEQCIINIYYTKDLDEDNNIKIACHYILNDEILLDSVDDIGIDEFPIAQLKDFSIPQSFHGFSTAEKALKPQKYLTKLELKEAVMMQAKGKDLLIVPNDWQFKVAEVNRFYNEGTSAFAVTEVSTQGRQINNDHSLVNIGTSELKELRELQLATISDFKNSVGINEVYEGSSFGSIETTSGVAKAAEKTSEIDNTSVINENRYLECLFRIIGKFIQKYSPREYLIDNERQHMIGNEIDPSSLGSPEMPQQPPMDNQMAMGMEQPPMSPEMGMGIPPEMGMEQSMVPPTGMPPEMGMGQPSVAGPEIPTPEIPNTRFQSLNIKDSKGSPFSPDYDPEAEGDNEFSGMDFNIDIDVSYQTAAQKEKTDQIVRQFLERSQQSGTPIDGAIYASFMSYLGVDPKIGLLMKDTINKALEKQEQQKQAELQQKQQSTNLGAQSKAMQSLGQMETAKIQDQTKRYEIDQKSLMAQQQMEAQAMAQQQMGGAPQGPAPQMPPMPNSGGSEQEAALMQALGPMLQQAMAAQGGAPAQPEQAPISGGQPPDISALQNLA